MRQAAFVRMSVPGISSVRGRKKAEQKAADKDRAIADRDAEIEMLKKGICPLA